MPAIDAGQSWRASDSECWLLVRGGLLIRCSHRDMRRAQGRRHWSSMRRATHIQLRGRGQSGARRPRRLPPKTLAIQGARSLGACEPTMDRCRGRRRTMLRDPMQRADVPENPIYPWRGVLPPARQPNVRCREWPPAQHGPRRRGCPRRKEKITQAQVERIRL
jgi:hypothetical protein